MCYTSNSSEEKRYLTWRSLQSPTLSGQSPADYRWTTTELAPENYMKIHIIFRWLFGGCLTGQLVQRTFQWTFRWTDTGHRHEKAKELIIVLYILINKQLITLQSEF